MAKFDISKHGDYLEKMEVVFLRERLSAYEQIWSQLIGHDGKGKLPELSLLPQAKLIRADFGDRMYTCLESLICMRTVIEDDKTLKIEQYDELNYRPDLAFL